MRTQGSVIALDSPAATFVAAATAACAGPMLGLAETLTAFAAMIMGTIMGTITGTTPISTTETTI